MADAPNDRPPDVIPDPPGEAPLGMPASASGDGANDTSEPGSEAQAGENHDGESHSSGGVEPDGDEGVQAAEDPGARGDSQPLDGPDAPEVPSDETVIPHHFDAPVMIALERLDNDETFLVRSRESLEDISGLATDIARLGQLFPIDVRVVEADRLQIVSGFRRVEALRFLQREKVVARLHTDLTDDDATLMSLAAAIHSRSVEPEALSATRLSLRSAGRLTAAARDMLDKALATESSLAPENVDEEVDADELAGDVTMRLGQCNQDLSLLADVFEELDGERRTALLEQLRYSVELVTFLETKK